MGSCREVYLQCPGVCNGLSILLTSFPISKEMSGLVQVRWMQVLLQWFIYFLINLLYLFKSVPGVGTQPRQEDFGNIQAVHEAKGAGSYEGV